jgi:uncharacterized NAD(P)/FAD-binding protein YdhS
MTKKRTVIVGSGPTGVAVVTAYRLAAYREDPSSLHLTMVDPGGQNCGGPAFGPDNEGVNSLLCNMPASAMSITPDPWDFVEWLILKGHLDAGMRPHRYFAPRHVFGTYLTEHLRKAIELLKRRGVTVEVITASVDALDQRSGQWRLVLSNGNALDANQVILATGGFKSDSYYELNGSARVYQHAWPFEQLSAIPKDASVVIVGTSLTFLDAVKSLDGFGHTGPIFATSGSGILPAVRPDYDPNFKVRYSTPAALQRWCDGWSLPLSVDVVFRALQADLLAVGVPESETYFLRAPRFSDPDSLIRQIQDQLDRARSDDLVFTVLHAFCENLPDIWHMLPVAERVRFGAQFATHFAAVAFPCPPVNGVKMLNWFKTGRVSINGTLDRRAKTAEIFSETPDGIEVRYRNGRSNVVDFVINATGLSYTLTSPMAPDLYRQLVTDKILIPNPFGGAEVEFATGVAIDEHGMQQRGLYVVGPMTRGVHWYTNSVEMNARAATRAVNHIFFGDRSSLGAE